MNLDLMAMFGKLKRYEEMWASKGCSKSPSAEEPQRQPLISIATYGLVDWVAEKFIFEPITFCLDHRQLSFCSAIGADRFKIYIVVDCYFLA